jgi:hypothetical protein
VAFSTCKHYPSTWGNTRFDPNRGVAGDMAFLQGQSAHPTAATLAVILPAVSLDATHGMRLTLGRVSYVQAGPKARTYIQDESRLMLSFSEDGDFAGADAYSVIDQTGHGRGPVSLIVRYHYTVLRLKDLSDAQARLDVYGQAASDYTIRALRAGPGPVRVPTSPSTVGARPVAVYALSAAASLGTRVIEATRVSPALCRLPTLSVPIGTYLATSEEGAPPNAAITSTARGCAMAAPAGSTLGALVDFPGFRVWTATPMPEIKLFSNTERYTLPNGADVVRGALACSWISMSLGPTPSYPTTIDLATVTGPFGATAPRITLADPTDAELVGSRYLVVRKACVVRILFDLRGYRLTFA